MTHQSPYLGPLSLAIAAELRAEVLRQGLTTREIGERINRTHTLVSNTLRGRRVMDVETLAAIAEILGLDPLAILGRAIEASRGNGAV